MSPSRDLDRVARRLLAADPALADEVPAFFFDLSPRGPGLAVRGRF